MGLTSRDFNKDFKKYGYKLEYGGYKLYSIDGTTISD